MSKRTKIVSLSQHTVGGSATQEDIAVNIVKGVVREESGEGGKGEAAGVGGGGEDLDLLHRLQQQHQGGGGQARHAWSPPVINTTDGSHERTVASLLLERRGANGDGCGKDASIHAGHD